MNRLQEVATVVVGAVIICTVFLAVLKLFGVPTGAERAEEETRACLALKCSTPYTQPAQLYRLGCVCIERPRW